MAEWRLIVTKIDGTNPEEILDFDLPGREPSLTEVLSGGTEATILVQPEYAYLFDRAGERVLRKWQNGIFFERDGDIVGGGIYVDHQEDPQSSRLTIEISGFANYPADMPYTSSWSATDVDPLDVFRHVWSHLQSQPGGNLGVKVDQTKSGQKIGRKVAQGEYDTQNGPLAFEYEPVTLNWYSTHDLGGYLAQLAENTPFEFIEEHRWADERRESIEHFIRLGYPRLGRIRDDVRFVVNENVAMPPLAGAEEEYAREVLALGAGEGSAMLRATVSRSGEDRIRRVAVVEDKSAQTAQSINAVAQAEILNRTGGDRIAELKALPHADELYSIIPGDLVPLYGSLADPKAVRYGTQEKILTMSGRFATFNVNGAGESTFNNRLPGIVSSIRAVHPELIVFQEVRDFRGQDKALLKALHDAGETQYVMIPGPYRTCMIYDSRTWRPRFSKMVEHKLPYDRWASYNLMTHIPSGLEATAWNVHFIHDNPPARIKQAESLVPFVVARGPSFGGGDMNSTTRAAGGPRDQMKRAGIIEMASILGDAVVNRQLDSHDSYGPNPAKGDWIDHLFVSQGPRPTYGGLYDTGSASDHNIIYMDFEWSQTVNETVVQGYDQWVRVVERTITPDEGGLAFTVVAPDTI